MSDLSIKNFKLFKNKTSFKLNPITLLLGANGSGKSSFIQILNLIENNASFFNSSLDEFSFFQHLFNDKDKPLELTFEISKNLFQKNVLSLGFTPDLPGNFWIDTISEKFELNYLNEKDEVVFETHYSSEHELYISINIPLFYNILEVNSCKHLADKLRLSDLPQKNIKLSTKMSYRMTDIEFEFGFFNYMFYAFIEKCALNEVSISREEFNSEISRIFNNQYNIDNKGKTIKKSKRLNLKVIKLNNYGNPQKIYTDKDPFGKLVSSLFEMQSFSHPFFLKWTREFFGISSNFNVKKIHEEFEIFEVKLDNKYLTEHGTGIYRICFLLLNLMHLFDDLYLEELDHEENNKLENCYQSFINRRYLVLEEPEANLHPDFQIKLAEMIFDLNHWLNNRFNQHNNESIYKFNILVETHSEYMIRTFQYLIAKNEGSENQVGIINFGSGSDRGKVKHISVRPNGSLSDNFYSGFFNYAEDLRLKLDAVNIKRYN